MRRIAIKVDYRVVNSLRVKTEETIGPIYQVAVGLEVTRAEL